MHAGKEPQAHKVEKRHLICDSDAPQVGSARSDLTRVVKVKHRKANRRKTRPFCIYIIKGYFVPSTLLFDSTPDIQMWEKNIFSNVLITSMQRSYIYSKLKDAFHTASNPLTVLQMLSMGLIRKCYERSSALNQYWI